MTKEELTSKNKAQLTELARDYHVIKSNNEAKNMKKDELIKRVFEAIKKEERENEMMKEEKKEESKSNFETLKTMLATIENCYIINETERRLTTNKVMYCKRANNKVRAYLKLKTNDSLATEKNTQYKANVLIDLSDSYAIYTLRRLYAR